MSNMIYGFNPSGYVKLPDAFHALKFPYWMIRVNGRDKSLRVKYYRIVRKEKLRLHQIGFSIELINAACKYLVCLKEDRAYKVEELLSLEQVSPKQYEFDFF